MACKFTYKGKEFNSEQEVIDFIEETKPSPQEERELFILMKASEQGVTEQDIRNQEKTFNNILTNKGNEITKDDQGYLVNGVRVKNRVTDKAKAKLEYIFRNRQINETEYEQRVNELKAEEGTVIHKYIEDIFDTFVDKEGFLRKQPLDDTDYMSKLNSQQNLIYRQLRANLRKRLSTFPDGTRFMSEIKVYDPRKDEAGTIDFLAITPKGKVTILDWKSINLNTKKYKDIPDYKQEYWRTQIGEYKKILIDNYGIKGEDVVKAEAIPIKTTFTPGDPVNEVLPKLVKIEIGNIDPMKETTDYLLPVPLREQSSGDSGVDAILEKLYAFEKKIKGEKVSDNRKDLKVEQLRALQAATRQLQVKKAVDALLEQAEIYNKRVDKTLEDYKNLKDKDPKTVPNSELSKMADEFFDSDVALELYGELYTYLHEVLGEQDIPKVAKLSSDARIKRFQIQEAEKQFVSKFIAERVGITDFLSPERVVKGLTKMFTSLSQGPTKAMATLWELVSMSKQRADFKIDEDNKKLEELKKRYEAWAKSKGLNKRNMFDILMDKNKHALIHQYRKEFYTEAKRAIEKRDVNWIKDNIDLDKYSAWANEYYETRKQQIQDNVYAGTEEEVKEKKARELKNLDEDFSPENMLFNNNITKFPLDVNFSEEYKELLKNKPALDFYNYIREKNEYFKSIGYIGYEGAKTFLAYVPKGLVEKLIMGGNMTLGQDFLNSISVNSQEVGFGYINEMTGKIEDRLPKYFTRVIEDPSKDLFKVMSLTNAMAVKYEYLSEIEGQVRALNRIEAIKTSIMTSNFGEAVRDASGEVRESQSNEENAKLLEEMTKAVFFGQKYINTEQFDQVLGGLDGVAKWGAKINKKIGVKLFPESTEGRKVSATKTIDQVNRMFQQKVLGLNVLSSISNLVGGSLQSVINAGRFFKGREFVKNEMEFTTQKIIQSEEGKKKMLAIKYFLPFTDSVANEQAKKLTTSPLNKHSVSDILMSLMRGSDRIVQGSLFLTMLENAVIIDGQIVNARDYLRKQPEYRYRYKKSTAEIKQIERDFDKKVEELIEQKGLLKSAKIENDELVIDGVERGSDTVIHFRRLVQAVAKDALGNMTEDDARRINLTVMGRSFMMFKNWIPRLTEVRFGGLKYNQALDAYEWGRATMALKFIGAEFTRAHINLLNALRANEKGIAFMHKMYLKAKEDFEARHGTTFKMTPEEFYDMARQNLKANLRDFLFLSSLLAIFYSVKALTPDDDEDKELIAKHKFLVRALDKVSDELSFFYTPWGWEQMLNGSLFPSLGLFRDIRNVVSHINKQLYGFVIGDEEAMEKAYPTKYIMKSLPVFKEIANYMTVLWPDTAKEFGMRQTTEGRR